MNGRMAKLLKLITKDRKEYKEIKKRFTTLNWIEKTKFIREAKENF